MNEFVEIFGGERRAVHLDALEKALFFFRALGVEIARRRAGHRPAEHVASALGRDSKLAFREGLSAAATLCATARRALGIRIGRRLFFARVFVDESLECEREVGCLTGVVESWRPIRFVTATTKDQKVGSPSTSTGVCEEPRDVV